MNHTMATYVTKFAETATEPSVYQQIMHVYQACVFPIFLFIGVVGNLLSLWIFPRLNRRDKSTSFYLTCLAVSDLAYLLSFGVPDTWLFRGLKNFSGNLQINISALHNSVCRILRLIWYTSTFTSSWILIAFNVEKCMAILYLLKRDTLITPFHHEMTMAVEFVMGMAVASPHVAKHAVVDNPDSGPTCQGSLEFYGPRISIALILFYWCVSYIFPFVIIFGANIIIATAIVKHRREKFSASKASATNFKFVINCSLVSGVYTLLPMHHH